jgi:hypothetical protein
VKELSSFIELIDMNWSNISLAKFQQLDEINNRELEEIDKVLFSACIVFDKTEYEMDNEDPRKVVTMTTSMQKIFETPFNARSYAMIGKYLINYDISKMTFGQYIELAFFLSNKPIQNAHYTLATISHKRFKKHTASDHRRKADYFLEQPVEKIMGALKLIGENFGEFNKEYKSLFGIDREVHGDVQEDVFNKRYGWIYSASQVAEYERITLDEAFALPIRQAFNALMYLKAKAKYEAEQLRKQNKNIA